MTLVPNICYECNTNAQPNFYLLLCEHVMSRRVTRGSQGKTN